jgi:N-formylmaleamate deformylase
VAGLTAGICEANGLEIHYLRTGGTKPPVVLLHGLTNSGACWTPLARMLEDEYDVVMPDARGHGKSGAPDHGYRYEDLADDVVSLTQGLGLGPPVLIGHSMGGMTAAVVASRRPDWLRGLVLADPTFLTPERQREVWESDPAGQHRRLLHRARNEVLAELRARNPHRSQEIRELFAQARLETRAAAFDVLRPPNPDCAELVSAVNAPESARHRRRAHRHRLPRGGG